MNRTAGFSSRVHDLDPEETALLLVDIQNDFCPGGALAIKDGCVVTGVANALLPLFRVVAATQDWHPPGHGSFASSKGVAPFSACDTPGLGPILWPDHCVAGTRGAEFHPDLNVSGFTIILRKGNLPSIDSYSAFFENDRKTPTGLRGFLFDLGMKRLMVMGLATDYSVFHTVRDAVALGFGVSVVVDGCRGVDASSDWNHSRALEAMESLGASLVHHLGLICPAGNPFSR